jgi:hypothetical protein
MFVRAIGVRVAGVVDVVHPGGANFDGDLARSGRKVVGRDDLQHRGIPETGSHNLHYKTSFLLQIRSCACGSAHAQLDWLRRSEVSVGGTGLGQMTQVK